MWLSVTCATAGTAVPKKSAASSRVCCSESGGGRTPWTRARRAMSA